MFYRYFHLLGPSLSGLHLDCYDASGKGKYKLKNPLNPLHDQRSFTKKTLPYSSNLLTREKLGNLFLL